MYIDGKWFTEPEVIAYVKTLKDKITKLESTNSKADSETKVTNNKQN